MQIGSFLDNQIIKNVTYTYNHRGMNTPYPPDNIKEREEQVVYNKDNGNLFFNSAVSWQDTILLQDGVDVRINLTERCFVDHIYLKQGKGSALACLEVFTLIDNNFKKIGNYVPETSKIITAEEITISVGYFCDNVVLRLNGDCKPIVINQLEVWGAWNLENAIWPIPHKITYRNESFSIRNLKTINASDEDEKFAALYLCEKLQEKVGYTPIITENAGNIVFCITTISDSSPTKDSFILDITKNSCIIKAPNRRSLLYAVDALLQCMNGEQLKCCYIEDEAFTDYRGVHFALPPRKQIDFLKNMIKYVFVPMRYNMIFIQISGAMRYDTYPEINTAWVEANEKYEKGEWPKPPHYGFVGKDIWEKTEVRELIDYIVSFGLEVIPEIQSWAHVQYITMAYPELAERIAVKKEEHTLHLSEEDAMPNTFYHHCMCPSHPDYYDVTFGIIDEVLEVFQPTRFVHMGHDEIYNVGMCSKCSKIPRGDIFAKEVNTLNDYIKQKNLKMIIWSDMLQSHRLHSTPTAINKIPRDIIMMDFVWYFRMEEDLEDNLLNHGFQVIMGNLYSSHYPRYESRSHKKGMLGGEVSTWVECNELTYAYEGKIFDFVYSAELLWNSSYRSDMRLTYNEIIKPLLKNIRYRIGNLNSSIAEKNIPIGGDPRNVPYDIRDIVPYSGAVSVNTTYPTKEISIANYAEIISFVHATDANSERIMWTDPHKIGEYVICYEDGDEYIEDILYAANIYKYLSPFGDRIMSPFFRHEGYVGTYLTIPECGKTYDGKDYTLSKYSIRNPYPKKKIVKIKLNHCNNTGAGIILFNIILQ